MILTSSNFVAKPDKRVLRRGIAPPQVVIQWKRVWRGKSKRGKTEGRRKSERLWGRGRVLGCVVDLFGMWLCSAVERAREDGREPREEQGEEEWERGHLPGSARISSTARSDGINSAQHTDIEIDKVKASRGKKKEDQRRGCGYLERDATLLSSEAGRGPYGSRPGGGACAGQQAHSVRRSAFEYARYGGTSWLSEAGSKGEYLSPGTIEQVSVGLHSAEDKNPRGPQRIPPEVIRRLVTRPGATP